MELYAKDMTFENSLGPKAWTHTVEFSIYHTPLLS